MLNNTDIIEKLTEDQKISLVTDISYCASDAAAMAGVPALGIAALEEIGRSFCGDSAYPSFNSLANSWNTALISQTTGDILKRSGTDKYKLVYTPSVDIKSNPYSSGVAEDPFLAAKLCGACIAAIEDSGCTACVAASALRQIDVDYADAKPSDRFLDNIVVKPFSSALRSRQSNVVRLPYARLKGEYKDFNSRYIDSTLSRTNVKAAIAESAYEEVLRAGLAKDKLMFIGCPTAAVRSALKNYRRMKDDVERGSASVDELRKAVAVGTAISAETLDIAVDRVIDFIKSCDGQRKQYSVGDGGADGSAEFCARQAQFAAQESVVLLKNANGILPLASSSKICVIGGIASEINDFENQARATILGNERIYGGYAQGYDIDTDRSDELIAPAVRLLNESDSAVVFVGLGSRREKRLTESRSLKLPANQSALIDALVSTGKPVIAVSAGEILPDTSFDAPLNGLLFAPSTGTFAAKAVFDIVCGALSPSGKLAVSGYADTDKLVSELRNNVLSGKHKMGEFVGYRRYASENNFAKYPFGFGLSYAKFEYSRLSINADSVEVTVTNVGNTAGGEAVQMYVGKKDSAIARPVYELKGFAKVMLAPQSAMQISFPLNPSMLETLDELDGKRKTENGAYEVYIGASSADIKLSGVINISGVEFAPRADRASDYLPSVSNIESDNYKLDASDKNSRDKFKSARPSSAFPYEQLFFDAFGADDDRGDDETDAVYDGGEDISTFLDDSVTAKTIVDGLVEFSAKRGAALDINSAREIVAAFYASRAVILDVDKAAFSAIAAMLGEFFGCHVNIDDASRYSSSDDLFTFGAETGLATAVGFAASHREAITIAALDDIDPSVLGEYFAPFIRYATAPDDITVTFGANKRTLAVSPNLWFLMRRQDGNVKFPLFLADMAVVITPSVVARDSEFGASAQSPNYYQFNAACARAERDNEISETLWKNVDKLERAVAARTPFTVDNKMAVQMEKFMGVCLECEAEPAAALDCAVAAKLLPHILYVTDGKAAPDDPEFIQTLEACFGDENIVRCSAAVKRYAANAKIKEA